MRFARIPEELRLLRQWLCWQAVARDGKVTKAPFNAATGHRASVTNRGDWSSFDEAVAALAKFPHFSGIGFVFAEGGPYVGIDLDKSSDPHVWEYHSKIYNATRSYTEQSPSGNGAHIIVRAKMPGGGRRNTPMGVEVYPGGRFFTMTGIRLDDQLGPRATVEDGQALVDWLLSEMGGGGGGALEATVASGPEEGPDGDIYDRIRASSNAERFATLFAGQWKQRVGDPPVVGYPSQSEADLALCNIIAQFTQNHEQIVRIFHASGLGKREKAHRQDYLARMLRASLDRHVSEEFKDKVAPALAKAHAAMQVKQATGAFDLPKRSAATISVWAPETELVIKRASEYPEDVPIDWIWRNWMARGKFHILGGSPGTGKSTLMLSLASILSTGGAWPDGSNAPVGNVLIWSGEDDITDTLKPRLKQARGDQDRIRFIEGTRDPTTKKLTPFKPARDIHRLVHTLEQIEAREGWRPDMIWLDPLIAVQAGKGDANSNSDTRDAMQILLDIAVERRCAMIGIHHFSKGSQGKDAMERFLGSIALPALSRLAWVSVKNLQHEVDETEAPRLFLPVKNSVGIEPQGIGYDIVTGDVWVARNDVERGCIKWLDEIDASSREAMKLAEQPPDPDAVESKSAGARAWLNAKLIIGETSAKDIFAAAEAEGVSVATIKKISKDIVNKRKEAGVHGRWMWSIKPEPKGKPRR